MKKIFILTLLFCLFSMQIFAQTEREILMEIAKQQAVMSTDIKNLDKRIDILEKTIDKRFEMMEKATDKRFEAVDKRFEDANKRFDILLYVMLTILAGIFGLIGFVVWDRQVSIKPISEENKELIKKIEKVEEREMKLEEKVGNQFKKIAQIDSRFAGILE